jgi:hypothetical protein
MFDPTSTKFRPEHRLAYLYPRVVDAYVAQPVYGSASSGADSTEPKAKPDNHIVRIKVA